MYFNTAQRGWFMLIIFIGMGWLLQTAHADYFVAYNYDYDYDYDYLRSDVVNREHRDAGDVDDWIERGNSTITVSPRFPDGIRLASWASEHVDDDDYDFAIASAIYLFDIPERAQYIEIKVRYSGEGRAADFDDFEEIAGRVWIRNLKREREYQREDDDERETLYGDTFVLRAKRRSETIKIPAVGHVDRDGVMELHIVAENNSQLDVEYIDVKTYRRQPNVRVVHRYIRSYEWRPWHNYTYFYFYDGPCYYSTDYNYYVRWSYPVYDRNYIVIRKNYRRYLNRYYVRYPRYYHRRSGTSVHINIKDKPKTEVRRLSVWTPRHEQARREYNRSRLTKRRRPSDVTRVRADVRATIQKHQQEPVLSKRIIQNRSVRVKRHSRTEMGTQRASPTRSPSTRSSIIRKQRQTSPQRSIQTQPTKRQGDIRSRARTRERPNLSPSKSDAERRESTIKKRRSTTSPTISKKSSGSSNDDGEDDKEDDEEEKKKQKKRDAKKRRR